MLQREKQLNKKPKNLLQGVEQGLGSFFSGLEKGISGLITKPIEGAQKGGFDGFL
jgi:vacuolar protein sorting-associated protein 13A/C